MRIMNKSFFIHGVLVSILTLTKVESCDYLRSSDDTIEQLVKETKRLIIEDNNSIPIQAIYQKKKEYLEQGDIEGLLKLKEEFNGLPYSSESWASLARLCSQLSPRSLLWPSQTYKDQVGAFIFHHPHVDNSPFFFKDNSYNSLNLIACLTVCASYNDPLDTYELALAYEKKARNTENKEEKLIFEQIRDLLQTKALNIFKLSQNISSRASSYARYFINLHDINNGFSKTCEEYELSLKPLGVSLPEAYLLLGRMFFSKKNEAKGKIYFEEAAKGGNKWGHIEIARIASWQKENSPLYLPESEITTHLKSAGGQGLHLLAKLKLQQGHTQEAVSLFSESGRLGCYESFIELGDLVIRDRSTSEGVSLAKNYYFQADYMSNAYGSRIANAKLSYHYPDIAAELLQRAVTFKDLSCFIQVSRYLQYPTHKPYIPYTHEELMAIKDSLTKPHELVLTEVKNILYLQK